MTPKEAVASVGKKVYGLGFDDKAIEEYTVVSCPEVKKGESVNRFILQPSKGDAFQAGIGDYFTDELSALLLASRCIDELIQSTEKEIDNLRNEIAQYHAKMIQVSRRIKKLEHLAKLKK